MKSKETTKSAFVETFGESPLILVLDFFLMYPNFDYSKTQVADEVGISRITIEKIWKRLIKNKLIANTRAIGKAQMCKLNTGNPTVKILLKVDSELSNSYLEEERDGVKSHKVAARV